MTMKKFLLTMAALAALTASCNLNVESDDDKDKEQVPVDFGAYLNRGVATKAGQDGELTTTTLQAATAGFGVFAYYTADDLYTQGARPDFMYNEKVTYNGSKWVYEPAKYWPNQYGAAASSDEIDRLTFFAYAPYVEVTAGNGIVTGDATSGITALSRNSILGDPFVKYVVSMNPGTVVDLCWGVAAADFNQSADGTNNHVSKGCPYIDVVKPKKDAKIAFDFHHALAALNVQIDADVYDTAAGQDVDANTKVYVRAISFEGLATKGTLNLNSTVADGPSWSDFQGTGAPLNEVYTVYDGRKDGKEGVTGAVASKEKPTGLNPKIIQGDTATDGVTKTAVNVFNSTEKTTSVYVIPTSEPLKVTVVYDVETKDEKLPGLLSDGVTHGSSVKNAITKTVQLGSGTTTTDMVLEAGKKYTISLHLGLSTVKFDASVSGWSNGDNASANLPQNQ